MSQVRLPSLPFAYPFLPWRKPWLLVGLVFFQLFNDKLGAFLSVSPLTSHAAPIQPRSPLFIFASSNYSPGLPAPRARSALQPLELLPFFLSKYSSGYPPPSPPNRFHARSVFPWQDQCGFLLDPVPSPTITAPHPYVPGVSPAIPY